MNLRKSFFRLKGLFETREEEKPNSLKDEHLKSVRRKTEIIAAETGLEREEAELLALVFNERFFRRFATTQSVSEEELVREYATRGIRENLPPGPMFDIALCASRMAAKNDAEPDLSPGLAVRWAKASRDQVIIPTPLFDARYYLGRYGDVRTAGMNPFYHFLKYGENEGRVPHPAFEKMPILSEVLAERRKVLTRSLTDLLALMPEQGLSRALERETWTAARRIFMPEYYKLENDGLLDDLSEEAQLIHFLSAGIFRDLRPSLFFNPHYYERAIERWNAAATQDSSMNDMAGEEELLPSIAPGVSPFMHWLTLGYPNSIVPTPLFDAAWYATIHKDMQRWRDWVFFHFTIHGCREPFRQPSPFFSNAVYAEAAGELKSPVFYLDHILKGPDAGIRFSKRIMPGILKFFPETEDYTPIERLLNFLHEKSLLPQRPQVLPLVEKAREIEPLIMRPRGIRKVSMPPHVHDNIALLEYRSRLENLLKPGRIDTLVLLPHVRQLSGASRIGALMARSMLEAFPKERVAVLLTDVHEPDRPSWLDERLEVADFAEAFPPGEMNPAHREHLLIDLISGHRVRRVVNVNSRLAWNLYTSFGRQLATWVDLYVYFFCWDKNEHGDKGGYPIREIQMAANDLAGMFFDSAALKHEIEWRYHLPKSFRERLFVLYTPAEEPVGDFSEMFLRRRRENLPLRAFWAGRFDRQKRLDIVMEIARRMPELEIWMYGKQVLGGGGNPLDSAPKNVRVFDPFRHFGELPFDEFDFYLYTSEWDGVPNMIITAGINAIPTVASLVGGVGELLTEETGWPVTEWDDPDAYVRRIRQMLENPEETVRRAKAFHKHVRELCNDEKFAADIRKSILESGRAEATT